MYPDGSALPGPEVLDGDTPVLVSEVVRFDVEYRLFVLDGAVRTGSRYAVDGELSVAPLGGTAGKAPAGAAGEAGPVGAAGPAGEAGPVGEAAEVLAFTRDVLAASAAGAPLPSAAVVDVGRTENGRWAVVEANAAWASGGYAAAPDAVLDVVLRSAGPADQLPTTDRPFLRDLPEVVR